MKEPIVRYWTLEHDIESCVIDYGRWYLSEWYAGRKPSLRFGQWMYSNHAPIGAEAWPEFFYEEDTMKAVNIWNASRDAAWNAERKEAFQRIFGSQH